MIFLLGRDDQIRTGDPFVPNEVRYQLRYIPNIIILANAKLLYLFELRKFALR